MPYKINNTNVFPIVIADATETSDGVMSAADKAKLDGVASSASFTAYTETNDTASVNIFTSEENSASLLRVNVIGVSTYFSASASFEADMTIRRDGSGDGATSTYSLLRSSVSADLAGATISVPGAHTAGVVVLQITGRSGRPIYWTVNVVSSTAVQEQS